MLTRKGSSLLRMVTTPHLAEGLASRVQAGFHNQVALLPRDTFFSSAGISMAELTGRKAFSQNSDNCPMSSLSISQDLGRPLARPQTLLVLPHSESS